ncbi:uncharacterized protein LOC132264731 isoform X2 [Phlebotomus argentipes]|uniref:uncharacterized protein LOC132264731 isoform X2 n=1 Tax=Phlebotomus argentipes TaxID=94469 RepID=UPI002893312D|nr:uncharacterized protein LOC132264731 isoform X2 [Phlebotomus argentipes]
MIKPHYNTRKRATKPKSQVEEITEDDIADFKTEDGLPVHTLYVSGFGNNPVTAQTLMQSFHDDGPIKKVIIHDAVKSSYAFVTFADVKSALRAKKTPHYHNGRKLTLRPADSWHQPEDVRDTAEDEVEIDMERSILKLNDDCVFSIFSYLNLRELLVMEKVCTRFQTVAEKIYKSQHVLDFDALGEQKQITLMEVKNVSMRLGPHVHTLKATSTSFRTINIRILLNILRYCVNLRNMYLSGFTISQSVLRVLTKTFVNLRVAQLENCSITDDIGDCLREAKHLETLDVSQNSEIVGKCLTVLQNIKEINLCCCNNLQVSHFKQFCERNQGLKSLNIIRCDKINHICLEVMARHLRSLESLMICNNYPNVNPTDYLVLGDLPCLKHLKINYNNFLNVDSFLAKLADRDILEYLDISAGHLTRNTQRALSSFTKLKVLKLNYKIECNDDTLMQVSSADTLQELHIVGCTSITNEGLVEFIKKCGLLARINISGCYGITNDLITSILPFLDERIVPLELIVGGTQISTLIENQIQLLDNAKIKLDFSNTAESFCAIDDWEDALSDDDYDLDIEDLDDPYQFAYFDNGYDSDLEDDFFI